MFNVIVHSYTGLPPVAELILEVKACLVIMMRKCLIVRQTFVIIDVVKSFVMNKAEKRPGLGYIFKHAYNVFTYSPEPPGPPEGGGCQSATFPSGGKFRYPTSGHPLNSYWP